VCSLCSSSRLLDNDYDYGYGLRLGIDMGLLFLFTTRGGGDDTKVAEMERQLFPGSVASRWVELNQHCVLV